MPKGKECKRKLIIPSFKRTLISLGTYRKLRVVIFFVGKHLAYVGNTDKLWQRR